MNTQTDRTADPGRRLAQPERKQLNLGFIPLTDCAPLAIAQEKGMFHRHGLDVTLFREPSWANIRDKVCFGALDGGQMLAGMPIAATIGADAFQVPMVTAFSMSLNGNAITVSTALFQRLQEIDPTLCRNGPQSALPLKTLIELGKQRKSKPLRFAMVFPCSSHNYLLRYWLASSGIDPDRDVELCVIPPPQMAAHLRRGSIDGYCVGEPWNTLAVEEGIGCTLIGSYEIWNNHPEKVFGVTRQWSETYPATHQSLLIALIEAAQWLDESPNREEAAEILALPEYVNAPAEVLRAGLTGQFRFQQGEAPRGFPDFHVFHRYAANFPWVSHGEWFITQMLRWAQVKRPVNVPVIAAQVYRPDLYRRAAAVLGIPCPPEDRKSEGHHGQPWLLATIADSFEMGSDRFFDNRTFEPADPQAYLNSFPIHSAAMAKEAFSSVQNRRPS